MAIDRHPPDQPDIVDEAGFESFPASDPPAWVPMHVGRPYTARLGSDDPVRRAWNMAIEEAARVIERAEDGYSRDRLCADIRAMKLSGKPSGN